MLSVLYVTNGRADSAEHFTAYGKPLYLKASPVAAKDGLSHFTTPAGQTIGIGNEIIVKLSSEAKSAVIAAQTGALQIEALSKSLYLLRYDKDRDILEILAKLKGESGIIFAQPNIHSRKQRR